MPYKAVSFTPAGRITPQVIERARAALAEVQAGARARTLPASAVDTAVALYRAAKCYARRVGLDPESVQVEFRAEGVRKAYKYLAETTVVTVGYGMLTAARVRARQGRHCTECDLRANIDCDNRPAADFPTLRFDGRPLRPSRRNGRLVFDA